MISFCLGIRLWQLHPRLIMLTRGLAFEKIESFEIFLWLRRIIISRVYTEFHGMRWLINKYLHLVIYTNMTLNAHAKCLLFWASVTGWLVCILSFYCRHRLLKPRDWPMRWSWLSCRKVLDDVLLAEIFAPPLLPHP